MTERVYSLDELDAIFSGTGEGKGRGPSTRDVLPNAVLGAIVRNVVGSATMAVGMLVIVGFLCVWITEDDLPARSAFEAMRLQLGEVSFREMLVVSAGLAWLAAFLTVVGRRGLSVSAGQLSKAVIHVA